MPLSKEQKRQRRAAAAGPNPRPRGRAPVGANGVEKEWDREHGVWIELALGVAEQHGTAADMAVTWESIEVVDNGQHAPMSTMNRIHALHEIVCVTPGGSRAHRFEHTSPGGSLRTQEYVSPAGARQGLEQRLYAYRGSYQFWRHAASRKRVRDE